METPKAIDPKRITGFELGDAYSKDQLSLIIPFEQLESFHRCVGALVEKNKAPQPPDSTGYYITCRGTLNPNYPAHKFSNNEKLSRSGPRGRDRLERRVSEIFYSSLDHPRIRPSFRFGTKKYFYI